jgi:uncharacterized Tic20 family protein
VARPGGGGDARPGDGASLPQPDEIPAGERDDAMAAYLMMFASLAIGLPLPLVNLVASLVYWLVNRKTSRFVAFHSLQSLLSHLPVTVVNAGLVAWTIAAIASPVRFGAAFFWFLAFTVLLNIAYIVISIVALVHAHKGRFFYIPFFGRVSYLRLYGPRAEARRKTVAWENRPPAGTAQ